MASDPTKSPQKLPQEAGETHEPALSEQVQTPSQAFQAEASASGEVASKDDKKDSTSASKSKLFKAYPETRSLSAYMDDVIGEFGTIMETMMPNMEEVKTFLRAMMIFMHKHYTRRLHALAVMEGKGKFDAERVQYAAVILLYELLRQNRARLWGDDCDVEDGKMKALEICRLVADRTANLSRHGLDRYINQFENDTTALFILTTPEIASLEVKAPKSSTTFKIDLKTAEDLRLKVRAPRYSEMKLYVEDADTRAARPRRKRMSKKSEDGESSSSKRARRQTQDKSVAAGTRSVMALPPTETLGPAFPFALSSLLMSQQDKETAAKAAALYVGIESTRATSSTSSTGPVPAAAPATPAPAFPLLAKAARSGNANLGDFLHSMNRLPPPVPSAVQRALEDAVGRATGPENPGSFLFHQLRMMRAAQLLTKIKSGEKLEPNEVVEFSELNKWLLSTSRTMENVGFRPMPFAGPPFFSPILPTQSTQSDGPNTLSELLAHRSKAVTRDSSVASGSSGSDEAEAEAQAEAQGEVDKSQQEVPMDIPTSTTGTSVSTSAP